MASAAPAAKPKPAANPAPARGPRILVAEADADAAKVVVEVLGRWGLAAEVVHDGSEALLWIHRKKPPAAVLGGHLPGISAPVIAEIVRRTAELAQVKLIRIASIDEPLGTPEFEADRAVEPGELAHGIEAALESLNLGLRPSPVVSTPPAVPKPTVEAPRAPSADPEVAAAERLARIIVSDIVLYNQEKFLAAARAGNVASALEAELTEASALFRQRIPEAVRAKRNFLVEELERRAKS